MEDTHQLPVHQLISRSVSTKPSDEQDRDLADILASSRTNNGVEGLSGVLLTAAGQYLQVLEGSPGGVGHIFERIQRDPRHTDVAVVSDSLVDRRAFSDWRMANPDLDKREQLIFRIERFLADAPSGVREAFAEVL